MLAARSASAASTEDARRASAMPSPTLHKHRSSSAYKSVTPSLPELPCQACISGPWEAAPAPSSLAHCLQRQSPCSPSLGFESGHRSFHTATFPHSTQSVLQSSYVTGHPLSQTGSPALLLATLPSRYSCGPVGHLPRYANSEHAWRRSPTAAGHSLFLPVPAP